MTKIEKQMIGAIVVFILLIVISVSYIGTQIDQAGGIKQITIDTGKEIKDIIKQIKQD